MASSTKKIDQLAELLEKTGGDAQRLDVVKRTQKFKRSWIELAEALAKVQRERAYTRWGFKDFFEYCSAELTIKKATAEKLVLSYTTIRRHAPEVLKWDGVARTIPSYEAVDYYSRAVGPFIDEGGDGDAGDDAPPRPRSRIQVEPTPELMAEMKQAVFDEGKPVGELRKRFDPVIYPKPKAAEKLEVVRKANATAKKLAELLPDIDGLDPKRVRQLDEQLGALREQLDAIAEPLKEKVARAQKRATRKAPKLRAVAPV
ncbi:MAG: hypothetical protein H6713_37475 [Myxococcales bacterium]|nr:hypothetical protein [Myxococcales bacterium]MCB9755656.1 hypothetical protein [Myxococcales bacterium]